MTVVDVSDLGVCKPTDLADSLKSDYSPVARKASKRKKDALHRSDTPGATRTGFFATSNEQRATNMIGIMLDLLVRFENGTKRKASDRHISFSQVQFAGWQSSHRQMPRAGHDSPGQFDFASEKSVGRAGLRPM